MLVSLPLPAAPFLTYRSRGGRLDLMLMRMNYENDHLFTMDQLERTAA